MGALWVGCLITDTNVQVLFYLLYKPVFYFLYPFKYYIYIYTRKLVNFDYFFVYMDPEEGDTDFPISKYILAVI